MDAQTSFTATVQVDPANYADGYDDRLRWSSYWIQLEHAVPATRFGRVLEVGVGNRLVASYLRTVAGAEVTTVDLDPRLAPDVVSDVAQLPFDDNAFGCVIACQILEHMPWEQSQRALRELRRVARHAIISVPNAKRWYLQMFLGVGTRRARVLALDAGRLLRPRPRSTPTHYWELNLDGVSPERFLAAVRNAGWTTRSEFRNPDNPYHHFFILD